MRLATSSPSRSTELGRLWIGDSQGKDVRVFDADGQFVRAVGQPGEGPGEFGSVGSVRRWSGGQYLDHGL